MAARTHSGGFRPSGRAPGTLREMEIILVGFPDFCAMDLVGPGEVFSTASQLSGSALYSCVLVSRRRGEQLRSESGIHVVAEDTLANRIDSMHTLLVGGGNGIRSAMNDRRLVSDIARAGQTAPRVTSVCTGAFLLAEAGLLHGRRATTHWASADQLAAEFPDVDVVPDEIYVTSGNVMTSAGIAAGVDLALAIVADDHGDDLARAVAHRMVVYLNRSGGQSQFSERLRSPENADPGITAVVQTVQSDPTASYTVDAMARLAGMSSRHFARQFRAQTGTTPTRWVERVRVDAARDLLERTAMPPKIVGERSGFGSYETMRQSFQRVLGVSPAKYRAIHQRLDEVRSPF